ncbi:hypothetical protein RJ639_027261 [Escallonia herrerae]|uniref:NAF domain-containing protein n=1 Tax=Escallonia herrerae TaxID=1293975 RepID=A0AA88X2C6_9ASTE|nr:hypothetical protein RJ639_027261 [Escallonia herrerae]
MSLLFEENKRVDLSPLFKENERDEMRFATARPARCVNSKLEEVAKAVKFGGSGRRVVCGVVGEEREREGESKLPVGKKIVGVREGAADEVGKGTADEVGKGTAGAREGAAGGKWTASDGRPGSN